MDWMRRCSQLIGHVLPFEQLLGATFRTLELDCVVQRAANICFLVGKQLTVLKYERAEMAARAAIQSHSKHTGMSSHDVLGAIFSSAPMSHQEYVSVVGLLLAVVSNVIIAGALNLQKIAGLQAKDEGLEFHKSRRWWAAVVLMCVGEFGNFTAYAFAPATLVAPLGAVSVVANSVISSLLGLEAFRFQDVVGTALVVCGGCVLVLFAPSGEANFSLQELESYLLGGVFLVYIGLVLSVYIMLHLYRIHSSHRSGPVIDLVMTAIIGSVTVPLTYQHTQQYIHTQHTLIRVSCAPSYMLFCCPGTCHQRLFHIASSHNSGPRKRSRQSPDLRHVHRHIGHRRNSSTRHQPSADALRH
jgi:hypothetical protein